MENTDFIEAYDNVLTTDFRKALITKFEESNRKVQGETGFGVNKRAKDSLDITLNLYPEWKKELDEIEAITRKNLVTYMRKYYHLMTGAVSLFIPNPAGGMMQITPEVLNVINDDLFEGLMNKIYKFGTLNLQKYSKGQGAYHHWHSETYPKQNDKAESLHRTLLYMHYLNDVEEGGETEFFYQNKKLKPTGGQLVFAPSHFTHTHKGHVPISNDKYILTSWILFRSEAEIYGK